MTIHYTDDQVTLHHGDALDVLRELPDNSVDAVVTDPPYGIRFMGKAWDGEDIEAGVHTRRGQADMPDNGKAGRNGGYRSAAAEAGRYDLSANAAFGEWCRQWATECLRVLKPGGHLLAFGGSRTWHRLTSAIEDAGFEIRDSIAWLYGSGFPKSLDVSKAIDKQRSEDRAPVDAVRAWLNARRLEAGLSHDAVNKHFGHASNGGGSSSAWMTNLTSRSIPTWDQWQSLKSLMSFGDEMDAEVWRLNGRKGEPGDNWSAREVVGHYEQPDPRLQGWAEMQGRERGTAKERRGAPTTDAAQHWQGWGTALKPAFEPIVVARKPLTGTVAANVLEHGTGALNIDACRTAAGQDYADKCASVVGLGSNRNGDAYGEWTGVREDSAHTAGRWPTNVVLDDTQAAELDQQTGVTRSRIGKPRGAASGDGWGMTATGAEYDDEGGASRFFPVFRYEAKAPTSERPRDGEVAHPTVKPLDLMRWLVRLVTPPGGTVLEPFAGSGTTAEACVIEGFKCIAIEREADYLPLIVGRLSKPIQMGLDFEGGAA